MYSYVAGFMYMIFFLSLLLILYSQNVDLGFCV